MYKYVYTFSPEFYALLYIIHCIYGTKIANLLFIGKLTFVFTEEKVF